MATRLQLNAPAPHWTDLPFPEGLEITGHMDGLAVRFNGRVLSTHGANLSSAARGLTKAREVLAAIGDLPVNDNLQGKVG